MTTKPEWDYIWGAQVPRELVDKGYAEPGKGPRYRKVYNAILDGLINAEQVNGRYRVRRSELPKIADLFGLPAHSSEAA